jgi:hypothetical protein
MMSWGVGAGLGSLAAAGLEGTDVGGADVFGEVVSEPDEHPASATSSTNPSSCPQRVFIPLLSFR